MAVGLLLLVPIAAAARLTQSDLVLVRADDVVTEDLYAAGNRITIEGRIEGDLVAAAFEDVVIAGEVTGDVVVVAGRVTITGTVGGSVRVAAGRVQVGGGIAEDLVVASWRTVVDPTGTIGRDLINWGRSGSVAGGVNRDLTGRFSHLVLDGQVGRAVDINVGTLVVGPLAEVDGDVAYRSTREAEVSGSIGGSVIQRTPLPPNIKIRALQLLTVLLVMLILTAAGLLSASAWPEQLESMMAAAGRGWRTWLSGLGVLVSPLLAAGVLGLILGVAPPAAAIPLVIVLLPVVLGLGGIVLMASLFGVIPAAGALGELVARRRASAPAAILVGMLLVGIVVLIPLLRVAAAATIVPLGVGALLGRRPQGAEVQIERKATEVRG
ncbi:MAG TPA: polymer-forming cytoskeletal protein [Acidimicrobiia bacterium]|nr:polymer-forming cytoskeletal protein [Acidimicrobiia bacterium]